MNLLLVHNVKLAIYLTVKARIINVLVKSFAKIICATVKIINLLVNGSNFQYPTKEVLIELHSYMF